MKKLLFIFFLFYCKLSICQSYSDLDLSNTLLNENTVNLNTLGIKLTNKVTNRIYKVTIKVEKELRFNEQGKSNIVHIDPCFDSHQTIKTLRNLLESDSTEAKVASHKKILLDSLKHLNKDDPCKEIITLAIQETVSKTEENVDFGFQIEENQNIHIKIEKFSNTKTNTVETTWEVILRTPRTANYISHFGFTFSPNWVKTPDQYFSKLTGKNINNTDSFTITRLNANGKEFWKDLSLTANFLIPFKSKKKSSEERDIRTAWMAGVGVGGDARFTVFTGPALLFKDFTAIGLAFGVNYAQKLKGEYEPGQGLKEQLSFDQLHVRGIRPDIMLTLSFRLSKKQLQGDIENVGAK